jgi:hypothetical protein
MNEPIDTVGIPIITNQNDEKFGEQIVELFIARANAMRRAQGLSDLCAGTLALPDLSGAILISPSLHF